MAFVKRAEADSGKIRDIAEILPRDVSKRFSSCTFEAEVNNVLSTASTREDYRAAGFRQPPPAAVARDPLDGAACCRAADAISIGQLLRLFESRTSGAIRDDVHRRPDRKRNARPT